MVDLLTPAIELLTESVTEGVDGILTTGVERVPSGIWLPIIAIPAVPSRLPVLPSKSGSKSEVRLVPVGIAPCNMEAVDNKESSDELLLLLLPPPPSNPLTSPEELVLSVEFKVLLNMLFIWLCISKLYSSAMFAVVVVVFVVGVLVVPLVEPCMA